MAPFLFRGFMFTYDVQNSFSGLLRNGKPCGCINNQGYYVVKINYKQERVHRIIWELLKGPIPEGMVIDHIDGNRSNNSVENLRVVSVKENARNSKLYKTNKTGIPFIRHDKKREYYQAYCTLLDGTRVSRCFSYKPNLRSEEEALQLAKEASVSMKTYYHNNHGR